MRRTEKYRIDRYNGFKDCLYYTVLIACEDLGLDKFKSCSSILYQYDGMSLARRTNTSSVKQLLEADGIILQMRYCNNDLSETIIKDIAENKPVVLGIDGFYDPMCKTMFGRIHSEHFLVVSEADTEKEIFRVAEHDYVNENAYKYRDVSFRELELCFSGKYLTFEKGQPKKDLSFCRNYMQAVERTVTILRSGKSKNFDKEIDKILSMKSAVTCLYVELFDYGSVLTEYVANTELAWKAVKESFSEDSVNKVLDSERTLCSKIAEMLEC